ncbi:MAG: PQQ-binding-like beta-propeller repeat protein [Dehalococcoidales bacterium]|nr:PQQ-binding-like beta-propeller repeat protein [Dehalococcoidales bacterium]
MAEIQKNPEEKRKEEYDAKRKAARKRRWVITLSIIGVFCLVISLLSLVQCTDLIIRVAGEVKSDPGYNEWAMFHRDLLHSGTDGSSTTAPQGNLKWTFTAGDAIHSSPAVCGGRVYVGSRDGYLYTLDAQTGEIVWTFKTGSWVEASPLVVDGIVYCASTDGNFYALDAETGGKLWSFDTASSIRSTPAIADGVAYFGCDNYKFYAVDLTTGLELWHMSTEGQITGSPAVDKGIVLFGSVGNMFYSLNAKSGDARIQFDAKTPVYSSPAIQNGIAYFTDGRGLFIAMDITARNWWLENMFRNYWNTLYAYGLMPKPSPRSGFIWGVALGVDTRSVSSPSLAGNYAYVGSGTKLFSINVIGYNIQWEFTTNGDVTSSPAVANGVVYVGSEDGHIYAVDTTTGLLLWDYATGGQVSSSPAIVNGLLYVGSMDGTLYCFE